MKNSNIILAIIITALVISNLFFGYMLLKPKSRPDFRGFQEMQLTDEQITNVTTFFQNAQDLEEIKNYCTNNRMECFYYCRNINQNHEVCSQLMQRRSNSQQPQELN